MRRALQNEYSFCKTRPEEIITALEVTTGSTDDGKQLSVLIEQTTVNGITIEEVIADKAYSGKDNLTKMRKSNISPVVPLHPIVHEGGERQEGFEYNKDADFVICPAGEHSKRKAIQGSKTNGDSRSLVYYFDVEKCKACPLREGCYKPGAKSKTYSIRAPNFQEMTFAFSKGQTGIAKKRTLPCACSLHRLTGLPE